MKTLRLIVLLTIFLSSLSGCNSTLYHKGEQCSPVFVYVDESKKLIDADKSYCNVREYEFGIHHVGAIQGTDHKREIHYCDRCVGFKKYAGFATFWESVRREIATDEERVTGATEK